MNQKIQSSLKTMPTWQSFYTWGLVTWEKGKASSPFPHSPISLDFGSTYDYLSTKGPNTTNTWAGPKTTSHHPICNKIKQLSQPGDLWKPLPSPLFLLKPLRICFLFPFLLGLDSIHHMDAGFFTLQKPMNVSALQCFFSIENSNKDISSLK